MDIVVVGLFMGDEGKGSIVDYLASRNSANVVRFNGGSQCGHNVVTGGIHHTFSQFGSGTLAGSKTIISEFTLVDPLGMLQDGEILGSKGFKDPLKNIVVSENSLVITPFQVITGKIRELVRINKKGTCGRGVGETITDQRENPYFSLKIKDLTKDDLAYRLKMLKLLKQDQIEQFEPDNEIKNLVDDFEKYSCEELALMYLNFSRRVRILGDDEILRIIKSENNIFEGAQGTLLDCLYGFKPYITQTRTSVVNALNLLGEKEVLTLGLLRPYAIRHGPGPFPSEDKKLHLQEFHNLSNKWQGMFRQGWLDLVLIRYSLAINQKIDKLGLTCMDKVSGLNEIKIATRYEYEGSQNEELLKKYFNINHHKQITGIKLQTQDGVISKLLEECRPVYTTLPGWKEDLSKVKTITELPHNARVFLNYIEEQLSVPIGLISVGPSREEKISINI